MFNGNSVFINDDRIKLISSTHHFVFKASDYYCKLSCGEETNDFLLKEAFVYDELEYESIHGNGVIERLWMGDRILLIIPYYGPTLQKDNTKTLLNEASMKKIFDCIHKTQDTLYQISIPDRLLTDYSRSDYRGFIKNQFMTKN